MRKIKLLVALLLLFSGTVMAGEYILEKGKGVEVCEAYQKNLNSFKPKGYQNCPRGVSKKIPGFDNPFWDRDTATPSGGSTFEPYLAMSDVIWARDVNHVKYFPRLRTEAWRGTPAQEKAAKGRFDDERERFWVGRAPYLDTFDIDNDGKPDPVYTEQPCGGAYSAQLAVLTPDWKDVDRKKTERIKPHPPFNKMGYDAFRPLWENEKARAVNNRWRKRGSKPTEDAYSNLRTDVFFYKGHTYIDQWWQAHPDFKGQWGRRAGKLRVYDVSPEGTKEICSYRFEVMKK